MRFLLDNPSFELVGELPVCASRPAPAQQAKDVLQKFIHRARSKVVPHLRKSRGKFGVGQILQRMTRELD
jgi:hypothetical protein